MATAIQHRETSDRFLDHAEAELEKGDALQASEKAWGAVAHYLKAVAQSKDWPHRTHKNLQDNSSIIIRFTDDPQRNNERIGLVDSLHRNFYEIDLAEDRVRAGIAAARSLIEEMEKAEPRVPHGPEARRRMRRPTMPHRRRGA